MKYILATLLLTTILFSQTKQDTLVHKSDILKILQSQYEQKVKYIEQLQAEIEKTKGELKVIEGQGLAFSTVSDSVIKVPKSIFQKDK